MPGLSLGIGLGLLRGGPGGVSVVSVNADGTNNVVWTFSHPLAAAIADVAQVAGFLIASDMPLLVAAGGGEGATSVTLEYGNAHDAAEAWDNTVGDVSLDFGPGKVFTRGSGTTV